MHGKEGSSRLKLFNNGGGEDFNNLCRLRKRGSTGQGPGTTGSVGREGPMVYQRSDQRPARSVIPETQLTTTYRAELPGHFRRSGTSIRGKMARYGSRLGPFPELPTRRDPILPGIASVLLEDRG